MNQSIKSRDIEVDVAKGIGILLVILGHLKNPLMDFIYAFHMPLFFFVSGMFVKNGLSLGNMVIGKAKRLLIPFALYYFLVVIYKMVKLLVKSSLDLGAFSLNNPNSVFLNVGPIWFLLALFYVFVLWIFFSRMSHIVRITVALMAALLPLSFYDVNPAYLNSALLALPFFLLGNSFHAMGIYTKIKSLDRKNQSAFCFMCFMFLIFTPPEYNQLSFNRIISTPTQYILSGLFGTLMTISLSITIVSLSSRAANLLSKLGNLSLHIMATHFYVLVALYQVLVKLVGDKVEENMYTSYFWNFIVFLASIPVCYISARFLEHYIFSKLPK